MLVTIPLSNTEAQERFSGSQISKPLLQPLEAGLLWETASSRAVHRGVRAALMSDTHCALFFPKGKARSLPALLLSDRVPSPAHIANSPSPHCTGSAALDQQNLQTEDSCLFNLFPAKLNSPAIQLALGVTHTEHLGSELEFNCLQLLIKTRG